MKKLLLFSLLLSAGFYLNAQDLYLTSGGEKLGDTAYVSGVADAAEIVFYANFYNNSQKDMNVKVVRQRIYMVDGSNSQFCWGLCYPPNVDTSGQYVFIPAGGHSEDEIFSGHYNPLGNVGNSMIKYTFYNMTNPGEAVSVICKYVATPNGIAEEAMKGGFLSNVYPNPASHSINIDYQLTSKVKEGRVRIINLTGAVVKEESIEPGTTSMKMDVSNLNDGLYFYSVIINGDVYQTKKMVIQN